MHMTVDNTRNDDQTIRFNNPSGCRNVSPQIRNLSVLNPQVQDAVDMVLPICNPTALDQQIQHFLFLYGTQRLFPAVLFEKC